VIFWHIALSSLAGYHQPHPWNLSLSTGKDDFLAEISIFLAEKIKDLAEILL
jgi:hypothetical protein